MSNRELNAKVTDLEKQLADAIAAKMTLESRVTELESKPAVVVATSKSRQQAEAALELLKAGTVTLSQLSSLNSKYPSDPIYFVRTILKVDVKTNRAKGGKTTYSLVVAPAPAPEAAAPEAPAAEAAPAAEVAAEVIPASEPVAEVAAA